MLNEKSPEMEQGREEMGEEEGEEDDQERFEGSFMELLGSEDLLMLEKDERIEVEEGFLFSPPYPSPSSSSSSCGYPQMLHFGGAHEDLLLLNGVTESSLSSSYPSATGKSKSKSSKKGNTSESGGGGGGGGGGRRVTAGETTTAAPSKRTKAPTTIKVRKEKLGERINALQQLVSPFGKSDTATVLHEAMCYIRFLHDQVQVLSSPYLQRSQHDGGGGGGEESRRDLRSLGLCLVPVSCTENVANSNGADLWSPALVGGGGGGGGSSTSSSGSKH